MPAGTNGETQPAAKTVKLSGKLDDAHALKTLVHEYAHILLHLDVDYSENRPRCEVEAESVAYVVCRELGLPTEAYSFGYVAHWADSKPTIVIQVAETILKTANAILESMQ